MATVRSTQLCIAGPIHFAHPPGTERRQDLERAKTGAGLESHRIGLDDRQYSDSLLGERTGWLPTFSGLLQG